VGGKRYTLLVVILTTLTLAATPAANDPPPPPPGSSVEVSASPTSSPAPMPLSDAARADQLFASAEVLRLALRLDPAALDILRERSRDEEKPRALAEVTCQGRTYTNVSVQLKGFSTFRSVDDRPSLTLKFDRQAPGQTFHGLAKISLNNSVHDPSRLHEIIARDLFAAVDVPVPRATHVVVSLNDRPLGLYVLTEGFDDRFVARYFPEPRGVLFEGGTLRDIDSQPRVMQGPAARGARALESLIAAAQLTDPQKRFEAIAERLDLDRFISMIAVETILCHSDSYTMNRNNYRLYYSPASGLFTFLPHGMDRILGAHRSALDLSIVPPQLGLVSRALLSTRPGRERYLRCLSQMVTNQFSPAAICERMQTMHARLLPEKNEPPRFERRRFRIGRDAGEDATEVCRRLEERSAELSRQLLALSDYLGRPRFPQFDSDGHFRLDDWIQRPIAGPVGATLVRSQPWEGRTVLHLENVTTNGAHAYLICRLTLPAGRYRLTGGWRVVSPTNSAVDGIAFLQRWAPSRFQVRRQDLDWRAFDAEIEVVASYAPEEVELTCEIRGREPRVRLDPGALSLVVDPGERPGDALRLPPAP
jgi:hypothetical protein